MEHASLGDEDSDERSDVYNTFDSWVFFSFEIECVCPYAHTHMHERNTLIICFRTLKDIWGIRNSVTKDLK